MKWSASFLDAKCCTSGPGSRPRAASKRQPEAVARTEGRSPRVPAGRVAPTGRGSGSGTESAGAGARRGERYQRPRRRVGAKLQALLAMLALASPHPVSDDRLIEELWGEDQPANPANSLQAQVSQLRRLLGREVVARRSPGYALAVEPDAVDAHRLEVLVEQARRAAADGDHRGAAQHCRSALDLVRDLLPGDLPTTRSPGSGRSPRGGVPRR